MPDAFTLSLPQAFVQIAMNFLSLFLYLSLAYTDCFHGVSLYIYIIFIYLQISPTLLIYLFLCPKKIFSIFLIILLVSKSHPYAKRREVRVTARHMASVTPARADRTRSHVTRLKTVN